MIPHEFVPPSRSKATIVVAEDDAFFRALICNLLESHGYHVVAFSGGDAALQAARELHAQILITDLIMDEGEGISTIIETRKTDKDIKILTVSANARYLNYAQKSGADCIMQKPIKSRELLATIKELQSGYPLGLELEAAAPDANSAPLSAV